MSAFFALGPPPHHRNSRHPGREQPGFSSRRLLLGLTTVALPRPSAPGLDPYELIGIARNESDFHVNITSPDGKDCGITQTRTTYSKFRCKQLNSDVWRWRSGKPHAS